MKTYSCQICKTKPDQISHHKSHLETERHQNKKEIFELKLSKYTDEKLIELYNTRNISEIIKNMETLVHKNEDLQLNENQMVMSSNTPKIKTFDEKKDEMTYVMTAEELKEKIHEIHNFLRNSGAGYGMNAMKIFMVFYGLKRIEELGTNAKENLNIKFSDILRKCNESTTPSEISKYIYEDLLDSISKCAIRNILFHEIPRGIQSNGYVFSKIIKYVEEVFEIERVNNIQLAGKIYEYFIGRDETAISELGAYFTNRYIVDFIIERINPKLNEDGTLPTMIDMFGGSGGFTIRYITYMKEQYPEMIDWKTQLSNITHYDINEDVIRIAGFEFYNLTDGICPNMDENVTFINAFTNEYDRKYKYVLTNPPYGGDKATKSRYQEYLDVIINELENDIKTIKDKEIVKKRKEQLFKLKQKQTQDKENKKMLNVSIDTCSSQLKIFAEKYNLSGKDKESCSLMLLMDTVEIGGTVAGVLKEGVFFNKIYKDLREVLIRNFNVREVISVPSDQFENTKTKTSIVIFDNTPENTTQNVIFSEFIVEKYTKHEFVDDDYGYRQLIEYAGDIKGIKNEILCEISADEILQHPNCSLNGKDYNKKQIRCGEGYQLVRLGDICKFMPKSKRKASYATETGKYNFYTSSDTVKKCDEADYNEECLIVGDGGIANIQIDNSFSCSDHNHLIKTSHNFYIYSLFKGNMWLLSNGFRGSTLKNLSKEYLQNLQIPIPKSPDKIQEWVDRISVPYNEKIQKEAKIKELETFVQNRIREIGEDEECEDVELGSVCSFKSGKKRKVTDGLKTGLYPLFSSSLNIDYWIDTYDYNEQCIIINTINGSGKYNLQHANKFCATSNTLIFNTSSVNLTLYIYYYGLIHIDIISKLSNGSTKQKMGKRELSNFKIRLPKNKQLIEELEPIFQQIEQLQQEVKNVDKLYKQLIQDLGKEAIINPSSSSEAIINPSSSAVNEIVETNSPIPQESVPSPKPKKSKSSKEKKDDISDYLKPKRKKNVIIKKE